MFILCSLSFVCSYRRCSLWLKWIFITHNVCVYGNFVIIDIFMRITNAHFTRFARRDELIIASRHTVKLRQNPHLSFSPPNRHTHTFRAANHVRIKIDRLARNDPARACVVVMWSSTSNDTIFCCCWFVCSWFIHSNEVSFSVVQKVRISSSRIAEIKHQFRSDITDSHNVSLDYNNNKSSFFSSVLCCASLLITFPIFTDSDTMKIRRNIQILAFNSIERSLASPSLHFSHRTSIETLYKSSQFERHLYVILENSLGTIKLCMCCELCVTR